MQFCRIVFTEIAIFRRISMLIITCLETRGPVVSRNSRRREMPRYSFRSIHVKELINRQLCCFERNAV